MVASINEQVSDTSDPSTLAKRLPAAEKQSRLDVQAKRLVGLKLAGELVPQAWCTEISIWPVDVETTTQAPRPNVCVVSMSALTVIILVTAWRHAGPNRLY